MLSQVPKAGHGAPTEIVNSNGQLDRWACAHNLGMTLRQSSFAQSWMINYVRSRKVSKRPTERNCPRSTVEIRGRQAATTQSAIRITTRGLQAFALRESLLKFRT
jgi:hypothetical protein